MNTRRRYWIFQIAGWGGYSVVSFCFAAYSGGISFSLVAGYLLFFVYSIGLTDLFRREIRRQQWLDPPVPWIWPRLAAGVLLIGAIQTVMVISVNMALDPRNARWPRDAVLWLWWGATAATGTWTAWYFRLTERRRREERETQIQLSLREAELRALESQVNPHFLFNCLNSIRALVVIDAPRAQDMLTRLANVLRHSLRHDRQHTVPLASEIETVSDYLALETIRFEERLRVELDIDPSAAHCAVPPMLLQTLVENAIKHGIAQVIDVGDLIVRAHCQGGMLRLVVENTGQLSDAPANLSQLGLANTRERLRLLYGDTASLSLKNGDGRVTATVLIPS